MSKLEDWELEAIKDFQHMMLQRMEMGREQYGMDYLKKDILKEIEFELFDVAVYALLQYIKLKKLEKIIDARSNENTKDN